MLVKGAKVKGHPHSNELRMPASTPSLKGATHLARTSSESAESVPVGNARCKTGDMIYGLVQISQSCEQSEVRWRTCAQVHCIMRSDPET